MEEGHQNGKMPPSEGTSPIHFVRATNKVCGILCTSLLSVKFSRGCAHHCRMIGMFCVLLTRNTVYITALCEVCLEVVHIVG